MSFHRAIQLGVLLIALVVSGSVAQAQEQGHQGPTNQPMGHEMSNDQMQIMHQQITPGSQTSDATSPTMPGQDAFDASKRLSVSCRLTQKQTGPRSILKHCASISLT